jgi:hypothetical protein
LIRRYLTQRGKWAQEDYSFFVINVSILVTWD